MSSLKKENEKYRQIYNYASWKLQWLEERLESMRREHESEKVVLEETMDNLRRHIKGRRTTLGHIYSYGNQIDCLVDRIITETDNENSSSNVDTRVMEAVSKLSILSRED